MQIGDIYTKFTPELAKEANSLGFVIGEREDGSIIIEGQPPYHLLPEDEIWKLKKYLSETDWAVVKCMELGISMAEKYPELYQKRTEARAKINELEDN